MNRQGFYSTELMSCYLRPDVKPGEHVGCYPSRYPRTDGVTRNFESGMRLDSRYKRSRDGYPLVSVVTTVFNAAPTIEKAILSVLHQTYPNIEYIIIDGASDDGTLDIIRRYEDVIDYVISEPDDGLYEGMNKGIRCATGDYILLLNADDWYEPRCLRTLVDKAIEKDLRMVSALAIETDAQGNMIRNIPCLPFNESIWLRMVLRHETMLVARELYEEVGLYDQGYRIIADLKLTQRMFEATDRHEQINDYLMHFRKMGVAHELSDALVEERARLIGENFPNLHAEDVSLLSGNYGGDPEPYHQLLEKRVSEDRLQKAVRCFLALHGV